MTFGTCLCIADIVLKWSISRTEQFYTFSLDFLIFLKIPFLTASVFFSRHGLQFSKCPTRVTYNSVARHWPMRASLDNERVSQEHLPNVSSTREAEPLIISCNCSEGFCEMHYGSELWSVFGSSLTNIHKHWYWMILVYSHFQVWQSSPKSFSHARKARPPDSAGAFGVPQQGNDNPSESHPVMGLVQLRLSSQQAGK